MESPITSFSAAVTAAKANKVVMAMLVSNEPGCHASHAMGRVRYEEGFTDGVRRFPPKLASDPMTCWHSNSQVTPIANEFTEQVRIRLVPSGVPDQVTCHVQHPARDFSVQLMPQHGVLVGHGKTATVGGVTPSGAMYFVSFSEQTDNGPH